MFWQPPRSIFSNRRTEPPCFLNSAVFKANGILTPIDGDLDLPGTGVCSSDMSDTTCCGSKPLSEKKANEQFNILKNFRTSEIKNVAREERICRPVRALHSKK